MCRESGCGPQDRYREIIIVHSWDSRYQCLLKKNKTVEGLKETLENQLNKITTWLEPSNNENVAKSFFL